MPQPTPAPPIITQQDAPPDRTFVQRVLIAVSIGIGLFAVVALLWYATQVLLIVFAGILVAILLRGLASLLVKYAHVSQRWALGIVVAILVLGLASIGYFVAPRVFDQSQQLFQTLPKAFHQAEGWLDKYPLGRALVKAVPMNFEPAGGHGDILGNIFGAASTTFSVILSLVLVMFVGLYLAAEPDLYIDGLTRLFPKNLRDHARRVLKSLGHALAGWLVGQGIDMAFIGLLTASGLWIVGVPLAFSLGLLAALANFIPNFGPFISFVPAALLALTINPHKIIWVGVLFIIIQSIEGYILQPNIQRRTVSLPPALTILAQVFLGLLLGPMGVILATPLMAASVVLVKVLYVRDVLHDPVPVKDAPPIPSPDAGPASCHDARPGAASSNVSMS